MKDRLKEPSTLAGLGLVLMGLNNIFDINEAGAVGEAITQASQSGDVSLMLYAAIVAGFAAIFKKESK